MWHLTTIRLPGLIGSHSPSGRGGRHEQTIIVGPAVRPDSWAVETTGRPVSLIAWRLTTASTPHGSETWWYCKVWTWTWTTHIWVVEQVHRYAGSGIEWRELVASDTRRRVWLEWSGDGGNLFVTATTERRPVGLDAIGLTEDDLIALDEAHSIDNGVWSLKNGVILTETASRRFYYPGDRAGEERASTCGSSWRTMVGYARHHQVRGLPF